MSKITLLEAQLKKHRKQIAQLETLLSEEKYKRINDKLDQIASVLASGLYFKTQNGNFVKISGFTVNYKTDKLRCHGHVEIHFQDKDCIAIGSNMGFGCNVYYPSPDTLSISVYDDNLDTIEMPIPLTQEQFKDVKDAVDHCGSILSDIINHNYEVQ